MMSGHLDAAQLSHLRHELRTPINHVIGYSEMLLEDIADDGPSGVHAKLTAIIREARAAVTAIQGGMGSNATATDARELAPMAVTIMSHAERIRACCEECRALTGDGDASTLDDVNRVQAAAERLHGLAAALGDGEGRRGETAAPEASEAYQTSEDDDGTCGGRILIVDDQSENRRVLRRRLERERYRVAEVADGRAALDLLETESFDLILLDMMMPVLDGYSTLVAVRENSNLANLPVLMISADEEAANVARCIEAGAEDYLPKPFDPTVLKARITACIEKKRLRDREREHTAKLEQTLLQLREAQHQLIVKEKMASLGELTAGIAHEIKNPLNFVINFARLTEELVEDLKTEMGREPADAGFIDELLTDTRFNLGKICEHGKRADGIVRSMLAHSRGGSAEFEEVDLNGLVRDGAELAFHGLRAKDAAFQGRIDYDLSVELPRVVVLPGEISRVVMNLAANGFYAAQRQRERMPELLPTLTVKTRMLAEGAEVEIAVRDNGTGIPLEARSKVFQPFYTTKPTGEGTGLGLSISYQIVVDQHGGRFTLDSEEGKYTEFLIVLPVQRNSATGRP